MASDESVTEWLGAMRRGDGRAIEKLWMRYHLRLMGLARHRLGTAPRAGADEEDVANSAFMSLCRGAAEDRFPLLANRIDLWKLLAVIASRKALNQAAVERRRAGRAHPWLDGIEAEVAPDLLATLSDECDALLGLLPDDECRAIALNKLEGYTNPEVGARIGISTRSVERKLKLIRAIWERNQDRETEK